MTSDLNRKLYLDLVEKVLLNTIYEDPHSAPWGESVFNRELRHNGKDCPRDAHTMVGTARLRNVRDCIESVIADEVPGDIIECGVWRGGCCIMAQAVLKSYGITDRSLWVADSFEGLPPADYETYPREEKFDFSAIEELSVSVEVVRQNFLKYDLLDNNIKFLKGWFSDTMPGFEAEKLSLIRLDGDMYESTIVPLTCLYPKLSSGGYIIIDDYGAFESCKSAVDTYRAENKITEPLVEIDWTGVYWRKG